MSKRAPFLRRRLGRRLREIREGANFTLAEAAKRLDKTRSALQRIETGVTRTDVHFIRSAMDVYDTYDETLVDEAREAGKPPWFRVYGIEDMGYVDVETHAALVKEFSGRRSPCPQWTLPGGRAVEARRTAATATASRLRLRDSP